MNPADRALASTLDTIEAEAYADLLAAAPTPVTQAMGLHVERIADATLLVATAAPIPLFNRVIGLGNTVPATQDTLDLVLDRYRALGARTVWVHVGGALNADDLRAWLVARGFAPPPRRTWAKVYRSTEEPPSIATPFAVRPVPLEHAEALARVVATAHGMPPPTVPWVAALVGRPDWRAYGAYDGDTLVGGAFLWVRGPHAWLGMGGTLEAHRRRGAQGAMMVARIRDAIASGCTVLTTETGEPIQGEHNPSLANMLRCGFVRVCARENHAPGAWP